MNEYKSKHVCSKADAYSSRCSVECWLWDLRHVHRFLVSGDIPSQLVPVPLPISWHFYGLVEYIIERKRIDSSQRAGRGVR